MTPSIARPFSFRNLATPCLMGVLNVTPNSFSDGGAFLDPADAVRQAEALRAAGAAILDVGAEASSFFRAGVGAVSAEEQVRRLLPVLEQIAGAARGVVSVDTRSALVAARAVELGATIINDISAGTHDPAMLETVAGSGAGIILMHIGSAYPETPAADDADIVGTVRAYLEKRIRAAEAADIPRERIAIDPGVGFGKTMADNWRLALGCHRYAELGVSVVLGASRKRFLDTPPPAAMVKELEPLTRKFQRPGIYPRDAASAALTRIAADQGVPIHRVHDVTLAAEALRM